MPRARTYAEKALALDETLAEAHFALGANALFYSWDWPVVERELKRALELNPNLGISHDVYGQYLSGLGRFDEAIAWNKRALELDPLSPLSNSNLGVVYYYARQYDRAIEQCRMTLELAPDSFCAPLYIGWAYGQQGRYQAELTKARALGEALPRLHRNLAMSMPSQAGALRRKRCSRNYRSELVESS
jgi:tetratricopeptide (TPR) repeat protein